MAHSDDTPEAVDVQSLYGDDAVDAFENILANEGEEEEIEAEIAEGDALDDIEVDDADLEEEEQETAILAPVSFNADEKAFFATLTPEQQQTVAAIETRRNADVQKATTKAAEAERNAVANAQGQLANIQRQYAAELASYAKAFEPQEPDYGLLATNPQAFAQEMAYYKQAMAQRDNITQQSAEAKRQADALEAESNRAWEIQQVQLLVEAVPEWKDRTKMGEEMKGLIEIGQSLGFADEALSNVDATEILALRQIKQDRDKAAKYDALVTKNMQRVRSFKGKPAPVSKPGVAQPKRSAPARKLDDSMARLGKDSHDREAAIDAFAAVLSS